ncbi:hypothetical protein EJB05_27244, partial [Eragrostis curvula]
AHPRRRNGASIGLPPQAPATSSARSASRRRPPPQNRLVLRPPPSCASALSSLPSATSPGQDAGLLYWPAAGHPRGLLRHDEAQRHGEDREDGGEDDRESGGAPHRGAPAAGRDFGAVCGHQGGSSHSLWDDSWMLTYMLIVHKELKEAMTQLDTIRYEVQSLSRLTPGQFTTRQHDTGSGMAEAGKSDASDGSVTKLEAFRHEIRSIIRDEIESFYKTRPDSIKNYACSTDARKLDVSADPMALKSKDMKMANTGSTDLHSQAVTYARLSETPGIKTSSSLSGNSQEEFKESGGLLNVLPISAESAGLLPSRSGEPTGSDLVLEAVLEAEVANNAKIFVSQPPPDQLPKE